MTPYKTYAILAVIFALFVGAALVLNPPYADFLFEEDGIMETFSIIISGIVLILSLMLSWIGYRKKEVWRFWFALSFLSFLYIGETLSWGEKMFNLRMPVIAGIKFDAFHDALSVSIGIIKKTRDFIMEIGIADPKSIAIVSVSIAVFGILLYSAIKIILKYRENITEFFKSSLKKAPVFFVFTALVLIAIALVIDDDNLVQFPHKEVVDEGLELLAVIAFLFSSVCGFLGGRWGFANKRAL